MSRTIRISIIFHFLRSNRPHRVGVNGVRSRVGTRSMNVPPVIHIAVLIRGGLNISPGTILGRSSSRSWGNVLPIRHIAIIVIVRSVMIVAPSAGGRFRLYRFIGTSVSTMECTATTSILQRVSRAMKRVGRSPVRSIRIVVTKVRTGLLFTGFRFDASTRHRGTHEEIE